MLGDLTDIEMDTLLEKEALGHLACCENNEPYIVPMAYLYHKNILYGQTTDGKKVLMMRNNPHVCFQVEKVTPQGWQSVICHGTFEEMDFDDGMAHSEEATEVIGLLHDRLGLIQKEKGISIPLSFTHGAKPLTVNDKTSTLFRIVLTKKTGKFYVEDKK